MKPFDKKIWLSSPTMHGDELEHIKDAYESNWMSTLGVNINESERLVREFVGCNHAVALSSGTAALHMAVKLAGVKQGDTVFCSDVTFAASVNAIMYEKATPVFIDSEYETWNMDPIALEKAFERYPDTKVIVVVNLYGTPAKYDEISKIASKHGAVIIEDAAESFGATYNNQQTGAFGEYGVISFNGNKIITGSSGGMFLTDNEHADAKVRKWSTQSRENASWYQHEELGYNYRMSNVVAGVVRGQLPYLNEHIARKKEIFDRYKNSFSDIPITMNPFDSSKMEPNFWLSCMLIDEKAMCKQLRSESDSSYSSECKKTCPDEILDKLLKYNAEGRPIWKPMHMQPIFKKFDFISAKEGVDVAADIFNRGLCLPSDIKMTAEEQDQIIEIIRSCFE